MARLESERMFGSRSLVSTRETVAVLAIMARRDLPWNRIAGAVEEEGSALRLLGQAGGTATDRLFEVDQQQVTLDQLEDWVLTWERDGIETITVLDAAYPVNLRMVHDRPPVLFVRGALSDCDERAVAVV